MNLKFLKLSLVLIFTFCGSAVFAQNADAIVGKWYNTEKDAQVEIFKEGGKYSGKIVWLKDPTENGKPKTDKNWHASGGLGKEVHNGTWMGNLTKNARALTNHNNQPKRTSKQI